MNTFLDGRWSYRSFRHDPIVLRDGQVEGEPELAALWSPAGVLEVRTGETGEVSGTLSFAPGVVLQVFGSITQASESSPASVSLVGQGLGSVNRLKGYFVPGSDHVVGSILCTAHDLLHQPDGTIGPFVLFPIEE